MRMTNQQITVIYYKRHIKNYCEFHKMVPVFRFLYRTKTMHGRYPQNYKFRFKVTNILRIFSGYKQKSFPLQLKFPCHLFKILGSWKKNQISLTFLKSNSGNPEFVIRTDYTVCQIKSQMCPKRLAPRRVINPGALIEPQKTLPGTQYMNAF